MKKTLCILCLIGMLLLMSLGCDGFFPVAEAPTPVPVAETPYVTDAPEDPDVIEIIETPVPTPEPTPEPTEAPTEEPTEAPAEGFCTADEIELTRPTEGKIWTPVFENITFLINGELMDSSQELAPDDCILTAHCIVVASEDCETEWTLVLRYNDADYLVRTAAVTLSAGENDVLIVIRADEPLASGDYVVKLYEGDVFLCGTSLEF